MPVLDYHPHTRQFTLAIPRAEARGQFDVSKLEEECGLDMSLPLSTYDRAVMFTPESYAAVPFWEYATERAQAQLRDIQTEIESSWAQTSGAHIKCPADEELWPYQKAGIEYALRRQNTLIGDQLGLGKTAQAICLANEMGAKRVLVLCPANIRLQWVKQIQRWSTMPWPRVIHAILTSSRGVHPTANWTVASYDLAGSAAIGRSLARGSYDLLVLDEGHYLKTVDTRRTRAVFGGGRDRAFPALSSRAGSVLALTGTPLPNRPREAYTLSRGLCWDAVDFMSEESFRRRFNPSIQRTTDEGKVWIDERTGRHSELQARLRANFMVRRKKRDVMPQLKLPMLSIIYVEETGPVRTALKAESMLDIDPTDLEGADAAVLGHIAVVRRQMGVAVAPQAAQYVEDLLESGADKVVVFAWHIEVLDILEERLGKYGFLRVDGRTSAMAKQKKVDLFRERPDFRVFGGNMMSIGIGTDGLQEATTYGVFAEPDWTPGTNVQCIDRLDRGGQKGTVQADFLVAPGSFGERILAKAIEKGHTTDKALDRGL